MDIFLRLAKDSDLEQYTHLLQRTYEYSYTNKAIGLTPECFSPKIFASKRNQEYLRSNLAITVHQKTWVAFDNSKLIGSITIEDKGEECEMKGFYVLPEYQGKGLGKQLFSRVLEFVQDKDIVLDTHAHNVKSIKMYERWGFKIDQAKGTFYRHWPEWPEGLEVACLYMRLTQT
jgi:ribosomal protein S18 acetylase RimI-like enzyme